MASPKLPSELPGDIRLINTSAAVLASFGVLVLAATAALWVAHQPAFALRAIRVDGDLSHNSVLTIRANAAPKLAGNFFTMDLGAARRAFEAVPWVRQAIVRRVWPNRLAVQLQEHRAVAFWTSSANGDDEPDKLVNSFGEVFEANLGDVEEDALPSLRGPEGSSARLLGLIARLQPVFEAIGARVDTLEMSGRGSMHVTLDTGAEIELGRGTDDEVTARTREFVATLPQVTQRFQRPLRYADLRHHDGYAVRLAGIATDMDAGKTKKKTTDMAREH